MSNTEKKRKRFYKKGETVWVIPLKKEGVVKSVDTKTFDVKLEITNGEKEVVLHTLKVWEIDKLKYFAKSKQKSKEVLSNIPKVYFAKTKPDAIIPSKRLEDAGYDVYANLEGKEVEGKIIREIWCPMLTTTLVPTGIAMALPNTHYFNLKHERGSTGKISMSVLSGVVDSGYRGEIFIAITPLHKDVVITSEVSDVEVSGNVILYPYSKAIAQGTIDLVPQVHIQEISYEELQNIESERGATKLGESGK